MVGSRQGNGIVCVNRSLGYQIKSHLWLG
jgi:hypothetical protein